MEAAAAKVTISFSQHLCHGRYHLLAATPPLHHKLPCPHGLDLGMYNILDGWGFIISQDIQAVHLCNCDVMMLTETKISDEAYCHTWLGCDMVCFLASATSARGAQGGVVLVV